MVMLKLGVVLVGAAATWGFSPAASAEPVKITNIGHGYYSGALYVAKQEKLFEKYGLDPDVSYVQGGALAANSGLVHEVRRGDDCNCPDDPKHTVPDGAKTCTEKWRLVHGVDAL